MCQRCWQRIADCEAEIESLRIVNNIRRIEELEDEIANLHLHMIEVARAESQRESMAVFRQDYARHWGCEWQLPENQPAYWEAQRQREQVEAAPAQLFHRASQQAARLLEADLTWAAPQARIYTMVARNAMDGSRPLPYEQLLLVGELMNNIRRRVEIERTLILGLTEGLLTLSVQAQLIEELGDLTSRRERIVGEAMAAPRHPNPIQPATESDSNTPSESEGLESGGEEADPQNEDADWEDTLSQYDEADLTQWQRTFVNATDLIDLTHTVMTLRHLRMTPESNVTDASRTLASGRLREALEVYMELRLAFHELLMEARPNLRGWFFLPGAMENLDNVLVERIEEISGHIHHALEGYEAVEDELDECLPHLPHKQGQTELTRQMQILRSELGCYHRGCEVMQALLIRIENPNRRDVALPDLHPGSAGFTAPRYPWLPRDERGRPLDPQAARQAARDLHQDLDELNSFEEPDAEEDFDEEMEDLEEGEI
ncbi:MAG: hypothetical protein M1827_003387 [Pycnora praestabilis]|nr:MAG: hypothetical protein M1827_003387 [Pycnora praestabilis]